MKPQSVISHLKTPSRNLFLQLIRYGLSGGIAFVADFSLLWFVTSICHAQYCHYSPSLSCGSAYFFSILSRL